MRAGAEEAQALTSISMKTAIRCLAALQALMKRWRLLKPWAKADEDLAGGSVLPRHETATRQYQGILAT